MPIATYRLGISHINNVIVTCSFEIHSIFLHLWHTCCIWKEVHFHSLFHNSLVQPLYRCSPEKLLCSKVLFLIEVLWSLFFFFFFLFPQCFSAVIFTICSQCIEKLFDLRCGICFFLIWGGRRERREASITVIAAAYFKIGTWLFHWKVHWILVFALRTKGRCWSQPFRMFE